MNELAKMKRDTEKKGRGNVVLVVVCVTVSTEKEKNVTEEKRENKWNNRKLN